MGTVALFSLAVFVIAACGSALHSRRRTRSTFVQMLGLSADQEPVALLWAVPRLNLHGCSVSAAAMLILVIVSIAYSSQRLVAFLAGCIAAFAGVVTGVEWGGYRNPLPPVVMDTAATVRRRAEIFMNTGCTFEGAAALEVARQLEDLSKIPHLTLELIDEFVTPNHVATLIEEYLLHNEQDPLYEWLQEPVVALWPAPHEESRAAILERIRQELRDGIDPARAEEIIAELRRS